MAEGEDKEQKTEDPTAKRLREALEKGNVPFSREVTHLLILVVLAFMVGVFSPYILHDIKMLLRPFLANADAFPMDKASVGKILYHLYADVMIAISVPILCIIAAIFASRYLQTEFAISLEPLKPKLSKISPLGGLKKIFSARSVVELVKNIFKLIIVGFVGFYSISSEISHVRQLADSSILAILFFLSSIALKLLIGIIIAVFFIAIADVFFQRYQHVKSLRMSKQEIKDEHKQSEGDPMIKQRLRQLRMEKAQKRMMFAVPESDVVITNPTHYSVALKYNSEDMKAPTVTAKGKDLIALKIREVAEEHDVPIVENPPLARALFSSTDIDQEIPMEYYEAVAKVISYVYELKGKKI